MVKDNNICPSFIALLYIYDYLAQSFRLELKLAMQASIDEHAGTGDLPTLKPVTSSNKRESGSRSGSNKSEKDINIPMPTCIRYSGSATDHTTARYWILRIDFFYLQKSGGLEIEMKCIRDQWMDIYDNFISGDSPSQINVDYDKFQEIERFKDRINDESMDEDITVSEYVDSLEDAMIEVWTLMETLYLHFQTSEVYPKLIEQYFPDFQQKSHKKENSKNSSTKPRMEKQLLQIIRFEICYTND